MPLYRDTLYSSSSATIDVKLENNRLGWFSNSCRRSKSYMQVVTLISDITLYYGNISGLYTISIIWIFLDHLYNYQVITYVCKDGMKMKEEFYRTNVTVKCSINNNFDNVAFWPECVSSKLIFLAHTVQDNKNEKIFKFSMTLNIQFTQI